MTSYEPYKTNILTVNEEVELRGIGDVQDTLDLMTGELTQRIGEAVLDGSEDEGWRFQSINEYGIANFLTTLPFKNNPKILCDSLVEQKTPIAQTVSEGVYMQNSQSVYIRISSSKANTTELFKKYLQSNPITIQYELATESVKTVVLNPSGTLASETPYMWKNGIIQLSSNGLVPGLDYAVTTSRVGVIETNMSETIVNEKRIHALEVMLAQSTITAAADAVSLQSDLESTTMSTDGAQLETENTQDDFLYEMILLLIENNAHDESLFDKVCMFYLYGKLSDEQFTNIYNLLYPVNPEEE